MRKLFLLVFSAAVLQAAGPAWLDIVNPIISPAEKRAYLALSADERPKFEENFWTDKSITAAEYYKRLSYADATFGSTQRGSSANTDPGRVYLSLGPPNKITRIPSSRIFFPIEIWYYDTVPGVIDTEVRLIFFQKNGIGLQKLYSPTIDTIRALLVPQAATRTMFGPNDSIDENAIRQILQVPPAEDEVIPAAVNVATGIRYSGNDEIIGRILSPRAMLDGSLKPVVKSRLVTDHPKIEFLLSSSRFGGVQVDVSVPVTARRDIGIEVDDGPSPVYRNVLNLKFETAKPVEYIHRLDLLPGSYRVILTVDDKSYPYLLDVPAAPPVSEIVRVSEASGSTHAPFEFDSYRLYPSNEGRFVMLALPKPGDVLWTIRRGSEIVWRKKVQTPESAVSVLPLPFELMPPGRYQMEAVSGDISKRLDLEVKKNPDEKTAPTLLSFNVNLAPAARRALIGHEWLLRGRNTEAKANLEEALKEAPLEQAQVDLARLDALAGRWDPARDRVRTVLALDPKNFDALCVYAYVEAGLQDYAVAAELYNRALDVEDSPAVRLALSKLPN